MITMFFFVGPVLALAGLGSMRLLLAQPLPEGGFTLSHKLSVVGATWAILIGCSFFLSAIDLSVYMLAAQLHHT